MLSPRGWASGLNCTLALSTGVIGTRLPVEGGRGRPGSDCCPRSRPTDARLAAAATALRTTDSTTKVATTTIELPGAEGRPHARTRQRASPRASA